MEFLAILGLTKLFGGLSAVNSVDIDVKHGEIIGLIGPNGAGKSTVLNLICGILRPASGKIFLKEEDITKWPAYLRARRGIAHVFQRNILFQEMTVLENVLAGSHLHATHGILEIFYKNANTRKKAAELRERVMDILRFVGLDKHTDQIASSLPHGSQRLLCVASAIASEPMLLLMDEPLTGMNMEETANMITLIKELRDVKGITTIVVEHNMKAVLGLCDRAVVLNYGKKMAEGTPWDVIEDTAVIQTYLGADDAV